MGIVDLWNILNECNAVKRKRTRSLNVVEDIPKRDPLQLLQFLQELKLEYLGLEWLLRSGVPRIRRCEVHKRTLEVTVSSILTPLELLLNVLFYNQHDSKSVASYYKLDLTV